jgi:aminoglycoside phosphotransferase (APT) family kinase protein
MSTPRASVTTARPSSGGRNGSGAVPGWRPVDATDVVAWLRREPHPLGRLEQAEIAILRHAPGKRLTARCRLRLVAADGRRHRLTVFAKQYRRTDLAERLARQLRSLRFAPGDAPVRFPGFLGLDARRGIVFIEALAGTGFAPEIAAGPARALEPAGALLAAFHRASAEVEKRVTRAGELARTRECAQAIASAYPELASALDRVQARLAGTAWGRAGRRALLHGSFRPNHLLRHGGSLALFDLESLRRGPAGYDLANWITALHYQEAEGRLTPAARRRAVRALLRGYRAQGGGESCARVLWLAAALLVQKQVYKLATRPGPRAGARAPGSGRARARVLVARAGRLAARAAAAGAGAGLDRLERELA